jgi:hypothetical protein
MCTDPPHHPGVVGPTLIRPEPIAALTDPVTLDPVEAITLTTLVDNATDMLPTDQGPVRDAHAPGRCGRPCHLARNDVRVLLTRMPGGLH